MIISFYKGKLPRKGLHLFRMMLSGLLLLFSFGCQGQVTEEPREEGGVHEEIFLADPTIFEHDGIYYVYGTDGTNPNKGFRVYQSSDLTTWEGPVGVHDGFALIKEEVFGDTGFWAPQVWYEDGLFYMAYTANENIAIAISDSPLGPFKQTTQQPIIKEGKQIDPFIFVDADGKKYLYHVRLQAGNRIFVAQLAADYSAIMPETLKECIDASLSWENTDNVGWPVAEGPTVLKLGQKYYMFYSANDFRNPQYAVGVAVSDQVYGPWEKVGDQALLSVHNTNWAGTGHGDVFRAGDQWYYVCHTHFSSEKVGPRRTAIVPFTMVNGAAGFEVPVFKGEEIKFLHVTKQ